MSTETHKFSCAENLDTRLISRNNFSHILSSPRQLFKHLLVAILTYIITHLVAKGMLCMVANGTLPGHKYICSPIK